MNILDIFQILQNILDSTWSFQIINHIFLNFPEHSQSFPEYFRIFSISPEQSRVHLNLPEHSRNCVPWIL